MVVCNNNTNVFSRLIFQHKVLLRIQITYLNLKISLPGIQQKVQGTIARFWTVFLGACWSIGILLITWWLILSWRRPLSYRNQSIDLQSKSMDWFLYDNDLRHERVNWINWPIAIETTKTKKKKIKKVIVSFFHPERS